MLTTEAGSSERRLGCRLSASGESALENAACIRSDCALTMTAPLSQTGLPSGGTPPPG